MLLCVGPVFGLLRLIAPVILAHAQAPELLHPTAIKEEHIWFNCAEQHI